MTAYEEQEELDRLKSWWKDYGNSVIIGVLLGAAALIGFRYWTQHTEQNAQDASVLYDRMMQDMHDRKTDTARQSGELLLKDYSSTPYAGMAGLLLARMDFDAGDKAGARKNLQWVVDHARDAATAHAARLRLARIIFDGGDKPAALALLDVKDQAGFEAEYAELRGDIYRAQDQLTQARNAYREALKQLPENSPYAPVIRMKLDDLGPEKSS